MKLEYQVCSLELSKRLKELGVKQDSLFNWLQLDENHPLYQVHINTKSKIKLEALKLGYLIYGRDPYEKMCGEFIHYSAFTVAELGEILFQKNYENLENMGYLHINTEMIDRHEGFLYRITNNLTDHIIDEFNQADALAKLLIYLIERK